MLDFQILATDPATASQPASHDNLFHSVLGILDIHTSVYQPSLDLFKTCRKTN